MIELFRKNLFVNSILLLPYILLLRINTFFSNEKIEIIPTDSYLAKMIFSVVDTPFLQSLVACLLIYLQCLIINYFCVKNNLLKESTLIPGLIYAILTSLLPEFAHLSPTLLANTAMIFAVTKLLNTYNNPNASGDIFLTGLFTALAGLLYVPYVWFIGFAFLGILINRSFKFVERLQFFLGYFVMIFMVMGVQYWCGHKDLIIPYHFIKQFTLSLITFNFNYPIDFLKVGLYIILFVLSIFNFSTFNAKKPVGVQKKIGIIYWFMVFSILAMFFYLHLDYYHLLVIIIPLSIFFAGILVNIKNKILPEIIHLFLIIVVVVVQFELVKF